MPKLRTLILMIGVATVVAPAAATSASAGPAAFVLACENGRSYPIHARAVSDAGDLVTGYIVTGRGHAHRIRLMPMGVGYRYAAKGLWLDGWRDDAELNFGKRHAVACNVVRS
ncbi:MAG: hypothetical protein JO000_09880 [Alphaproteobacteria bacterium]|nr:hypothetical protein [Alphaproteobacteria bacterium]